MKTVVFLKFVCDLLKMLVEFEASGMRECEYHSNLWNTFILLNISFVTFKTIDSFFPLHAVTKKSRIMCIIYFKKTKNYSPNLYVQIKRYKTVYGSL